MEMDATVCQRLNNRLCNEKTCRIFSQFYNEHVYIKKIIFCSFWYSTACVVSYFNDSGMTAEREGEVFPLSTACFVFFLLNQNVKNNNSTVHQCISTLTLCNPLSKRDNISESLLSECTLYTVQQRCCNRPMMYSFSICSCILNSLNVAHSD